MQVIRKKRKITLFTRFIFKNEGFANILLHINGKIITFLKTENLLNYHMCTLFFLSDLNDVNFLRL